VTSVVHSLGYAAVQRQSHGSGGCSILRQSQNEHVTY
jgi:hypothetical protein